MKWNVLALSVLLVVLFGSCASNKYTVYYSSLVIDSTATDMEIYSKDRRVNAEWMGNDGKKQDISMYLDISQDDIEMNMKCSAPVYIDHSKTKICINNECYRLENGFGTSKGDSIVEITEHISSVGLGNVDISDTTFYKVYNSFADSLYSYSTYIAESDDKEKEVTVASLSFSKIESPLNISGYMVYYTDYLYKEEQNLSISLYQNNLQKVVDTREKQPLTGRAYVIDKYYTTFLITQKTGKYWGWYEIRRGLLQGTAIILFPVIMVGGGLYSLGRAIAGGYD
ncbi:hypothetical protein [Prevotella sp. 10(H)]|uniref:hypothetical protein n=1 Tax=Prevotella sp. 10(H) TaxID=1158294 RepID=UPI0004A70D8B|nr:hypothetical protein [Prevotella sp. 10(H)]